ncbi:transporter substrate-binding domain-containing protein [Colwellia psychrerythraea]|uniref:ABC-type transporter, periplasmic subunit family 3 n=1 Tax=Colwellia psychrerythraea TaxID=28229 RepID=A0A099K937_COLPS|nr:transporter substrate-binding domain-containing protein [Colwellia psychrerythraea]KGJ86567.1 ABC-type transporter, periplasmic subunit family 3 [Colwellia psychrerythraea]
MNKQLVAIVVASFFMLLTLAGCQDAPSEEEGAKAALSKESNPNGSKDKLKLPLKKVVEKRTAARTWSEIKESGYINAVKLDWQLESALPRAGSTSAYHTTLLQGFADERGLKINWLRVSNLADMFAKLSTFDVDIIPRHLTITANRLNKFSFSYPLLRDKEVVIAKAGKHSFNEYDDNNISLSVGSAYIDSVNKQFPHWQVNIVEKKVSSQEVADSIADGTVEYAVIDGFALETLKQYRNDIQNVFTLPKAVNLAWAVNLGNDSFLHELNEFISVHHVMQVIEPERTIDFKQLRKDKLPLRVITRNSPETYFLWRGELLGFEYELMRKFADNHKVKLVIVVADSYEEMLALLAAGKGDIIAAGLSRTDARKAQIAKEKLVTSLRYNRVKEQLVAHQDSLPINELSDLKGRTITIRKSSSFWTTGQMLAKDYGANIVLANEDIATEILIGQVADKEIDLTIADSNLIAIESSFRSQIITPLTFKEDVPYAYLVRQGNPQLLAYLNEFIRKYYRGTFYNVVKNKYFHNEKLQESHKKHRLVSGSTLSPYDDIVRTYVQPYNFDWRLIVSQMYQESRFDPLATNSTGAFGLMQMLPRTARELGVENLKDPEQAIASGVQYLDWTRDRFSKDLPVQEQIFFSLASYNAGFGHVKDAQRLARQLGLRSDKWFNNVEKAMLLLQRRQYYKKARFGYVRGREPVNYVRDIHQRYLSYIRITD